MASATTSEMRTLMIRHHGRMLRGRYSFTNFTITATLNGKTVSQSYDGNPASVARLMLLDLARTQPSQPGESWRGPAQTPALASARGAAGR